MLKILVFLFLFGFINSAYADTVFLKNGRNIEGLIKEEDENMLELGVCQGLVKFKKSEIERITRSTPKEIDAIRQKCEKEKLKLQERLLKREGERKGNLKPIELSGDSHTITVGVKINNKIDASLVLDTGASLVILNKKVAAKLGINLEGIKPDAKFTLADGRRVNAKHIVLERLEAQGQEAQNVDAAIMLEEVGSLGSADGLLGMSFLKRFNFKVDLRQKKLILERLYP